MLVNIPSMILHENSSSGRRVVPYHQPRARTEHHTFSSRLSRVFGEITLKISFTLVEVDRKSHLIVRNRS